MHKGRIEAFSDGVLAILITIMVLELHVPSGTDAASLGAVAPKLLLYLLSFANLGIYWINHHHMFQTVHRVNGPTLWANLHLLFWLSLIPFVTDWMGEHFAPLSVAAYGVVCILAGSAYYLLERTLIASHGPESLLARAVGREVKGIASLAIYAVGVGLTFVRPWISCALYAVVAVMWLVPDRRIERLLEREEERHA
jgi:uncharacterized membrane protein